MDAELFWHLCSYLSGLLTWLKEWHHVPFMVLQVGGENGMTTRETAKPKYGMISSTMAVTQNPVSKDRKLLTPPCSAMVGTSSSHCLRERGTEAISDTLNEKEACYIFAGSNTTWVEIKNTIEFLGHLRILLKEGRRGQIRGDGRRLDSGWWTHNRVYKCHIIEMYTWTLYDVIN